MKSPYQKYIVPLFVSALFVMMQTNSYAVQLDPPILHCASVELNGDVTLSWTPINDPGGDFQEYEIYTAPLGIGPFTLLATVGNIAQNSYLHVAAGADVGEQHYYISTRSNSVPSELSIPSDTVATLFLQVLQSTPLGNANLTWTATSNVPSAGNEFTVWLEYPIGTWSLVATVDANVFSYSYVVDVCEDSLTFRIGLADASGCTSFSALAGDVFADATPPAVPVITVVSVDTMTGLSSITWDPSPEADTDGYIIVWSTPTGGVIIDTIYGQFNTTYLWQNSNADISSESFTVAAFDTCEVGTPPSPNTSATNVPHSTIHLNTIYDQCNSQVTLTWGPYIGWDVDSYQVLTQVNGGAWTVLVSLGPDVNQFQHSTEPDRTYCYVVKALQGSSSVNSLSNTACVLTYFASVPAFNYIRTVTVTEENLITVVDSVDQQARSDGYLLQRSKDGGAYVQIATFPGNAGPIINYNDANVSTSNAGYRYRVVVKDSCGNPAFTSNIGGNILLRATPDLNGVNNLTWNGYENWGGTVGAYTIYRKLDGGPYEELITVPSTPWNYTDPVQEFTSGNGKICYYIVAHEVGNPYGQDGTSVSNEACAVQQELIYIPNAFIIGGYNNEFFPVVSYVDVREYEFSIINRWGQVIWTTTDPTEKWDGVINGSFAPIGIYGYFLSLRNGNDNRIERRGTVTLLTAIDP